jgi:competence protein ComEC
MPAWPELACGVAAMGLLALWEPGGRGARLALLVGALLLGVAAPAALPEPPALGLRASISGVVVDQVGIEAVVQADSGRLRLRFPEELPAVGARIAAYTEPQRPSVLLPGEPDAPANRLRAHAAPRLVRSWLRLDGDAPAVHDVFDLAEHGGLLRAMALGDRRGVPEATSTLLRRTGTFHLLSISGQHIALVAGLVHLLVAVLVRPVFAWRGPRWARIVPALAALCSAWAYTELVGAPVPARRAAWMVALAGGSVVLGRRPRPWNLLGFAACAVVLLDPAQVAEPSFLLSFGAICGMLLVSPRVTRALPPDVPRALRWLVTGLATTVGATAGTLPITAWLFQQLSPLSGLANLLAGPLLGGLSVVGALLAVALPGALGLLSLALADASADLSISLLHAIDVEPWAPATGPWGALLLALACLTIKRPTLSLLLVALALAPLPGPPGRLRVTFLAIGQGDATLLRWPSGEAWLIDGGPGGEGLLRALRREGLRRIDRLILSHPHPDHLLGLLPVALALPVGELWAPRPPEVGEVDYLTLWQALYARGVPYRGPDSPGLQVLHPLGGWRAPKKSRVNDESLVLRVVFGQRSFLFTGDIEAAGEAALVGRLSRADVVKVPHHGSHTSSSRALVEALSPSLAVVSCGEQNRYDHPRPAAWARWAGVPLARTDRDGTIEVSTDGRDLAVRAWRAETGWRPLQRAPWRPRPPPERIRARFDERLLEAKLQAKQEAKASRKAKSR